MHVFSDVLFFRIMDIYPTEISGETVTLNGAVLTCACSVNTPTSNFLGGFKEGVGFTLRNSKCHRCMIGEYCLALSPQLERIHACVGELL